MRTSTSRNANAISLDSKILQQVVFEFGIGNINIIFLEKSIRKKKYEGKSLYQFRRRKPGWRFAAGLNNNKNYEVM